MIKESLATFLLATLPIGELRGALPVAIAWYKLPLWLAILVSVAGNMLPVYLVLKYLELIVEWSRRRFRVANVFFDWLFQRTRNKLDERVKKYGYWALTMFVAVPLPVTGAWTGSLAAFVFGLPKKQSALAILVGVCISAIIVTILTLGGVMAADSLFTK